MTKKSNDAEHGAHEHAAIAAAATAWGFDLPSECLSGVAQNITVLGRHAEVMRAHKTCEKERAQ